MPSRCDGILRGVLTGVFSNSDSARLTDLEVKLQAPLLIASAMITEFSKVDDTLAVRVNQHI